MMVDFPEPDGPISAVTVPGRDSNEMSFKHRLSGFVGEPHALEIHFAANRAKHHGAPGIFIFGPLAHHFAGAFEAGQGLGDLRPDSHHLEHRRDKESEKGDEKHQAAHGQRAGQDLARAHKHDEHADHSHHHGGAEAHNRSGGQRLQHVIQQPLDAAREDLRLALLRVVALDDAHTAQRFGKPAGHFRVDLRSRAEDRADRAKRMPQRQTKYQQEQEGQARHQRADAEQNHQRNDRGEKAADEFDQAGADEIAHTLHVAHDAGNQHAGLVGVVIGDGQPADVLLHVSAKLGNQALRGFREQLRQGKRSDALDESCAQNREHQGHQLVNVPFADNVVDQIPGRIRQHQARDAVDGHEHKAEGQHGTAGAHELPDVGKKSPQALGRG